MFCFPLDCQTAPMLGAQKKCSTASAMKHFILIRLIGIEPTHLAPEASALSTELQAQTTFNIILEIQSFVKSFLAFLKNSFSVTLYL